MISIAKTFRFEASHRLTGLPHGHKCMRLHGHSYRVTIMLRSTDTDETGMILDYARLQPFKDYLDQNLDHRHLGVGDVITPHDKTRDEAVLDFNPTAENLAAHLFTVADKMFGHLVVAVQVKETDNTMAKVTR